MNLKKLAKISPLIGAFLIFIGYLELHIYYIHWGIDIVSYLNFSEISLSFLNDTNTLLFFTILLLLQMGIGIGTLGAIDNRIKKVPETESIPSNTQNIGFSGILPTMNKVIEGHPKFVVCILLFLTTVFVCLFLSFLNLTFLYISFFLFIQLLIAFFDGIIGIQDSKTLIQISLVIILLGFTYCIAKYNIKQTEISTKQIVLQTNLNQNIATDKNFIFLGKTNNYYFFFDKIKNQSTIVKETDILKMTITK